MNSLDQAKSVTDSLSFSGKILERGFWLYVWEISTRDDLLYYVGRTGDSSSSNAQSPFNRMSQHLGFNERSNVLRRRLRGLGVDPEMCAFRLVAYGPVLKEAACLEDHRGPRDITAAFEKPLAAALTDAGYNVINKVHCRIAPEDALFADVRAAFTPEFPRLVD
ncbi:MAG TPA: hypothetical protein VFS76_17150 [Pyrinomonadaceae bacterium]|nr:hypothetical protein [Pyrinomonadaceae bacterium]